MSCQTITVIIKEDLWVFFLIIICLEMSAILQEVEANICVIVKVELSF